MTYGPLTHSCYNSPVCNLYSITSNQQAMRELAKTIRDMTGNFEPLPAIFPNRMAARQTARRSWAGGNIRVECPAGMPDDELMTFDDAGGFSFEGTVGFDAAKARLAK